MIDQLKGKVELKNYSFSGLEASQVGAIKSVLDYYNVPATPSWIYGMSGMAFLIVHDQTFKKPNAGPPESLLYRLVRNIGLNIEGVHTYAEGEEFKELQRTMWNKAKEAINKGYPVFAKNIDIQNQTSIIYGYDHVGYYTHSWHGGNGHEHFDEVIPWEYLGQSFCPCEYCLRKREIYNYEPETKGIISLHWATLIPAASHLSALKDALEFVVGLNEQGVMEWHNDKYFIGKQAYVQWVTELEKNNINKYHFSLTIEPIADARRHAVHFLNEIKVLVNNQPSLRIIDEAIEVYTKIASIYKVLVEKYPYEQPHEQIDDTDRKQIVEVLKELMHLEEQAINMIKKLYREIEMSV